MIVQIWRQCDCFLLYNRRRVGDFGSGSIGRSITIGGRASRIQGENETGEAAVWWLMY